MQREKKFYFRFFSSTPLLLHLCFCIYIDMRVCVFDIEAKENERMRKLFLKVKYSYLTIHANVTIHVCFFLIQILLFTHILLFKNMKLLFTYGLLFKIHFYC